MEVMMRLPTAHLTDTAPVLAPASAAAPEVCLEAHRSGDTVWIDWLYVAPSERRRGAARRALARFEAELPREIRLLRVFAADSEGAGNSDDFWLSVGFAYRYAGDPEELSYEAAHTLVKGVNGHPTPASIRVIPT
jgi:GNAT superfamily N-acetyltransferase